MPTRARGSWFARLSRVAACASLALGCGPPIEPPMADGGTMDDGGAAASVVVRLLPGTLPAGDGVVVERLTVGVASVHVPNDRGELTRDFGRLVDLSTGPAELMLTGAEPAVYGSAELLLATGAWGSSLTLRVVDGAQTIEVDVHDAIEVAPRCTTPVSLPTGGQLVMELEVPIALLVEVLRESPLPAPVDGVIHVDESSTPEVVEELDERLHLAHLDCDETEDGP